MASFGFSVGDFVTCLNLIREVAQALSDSRGSASEYKSLFRNLSDTQPDARSLRIDIPSMGHRSHGPNIQAACYSDDQRNPFRATKVQGVVGKLP